MCRHLDSAFVANRCRRNARSVRSKRTCRFEMPRPVPLISPSLARSYRRLRRRGIVENRSLQVVFRDMPKIAFSSKYRCYRSSRTRTQGQIMTSSCVVPVVFVFVAYGVGRLSFAAFCYIPAITRPKSSTLFQSVNSTTACGSVGPLVIHMMNLMTWRSRNVYIG